MSINAADSATTTVNDGQWEFQVSDNIWQTYPQSISLLLEREYRLQLKQQNPFELQNELHSNFDNGPIYYQTSNGNRFHVSVENGLQFDKNGNVTNVRRNAEHNVIEYAFDSCPCCHFFLPSNSIACEICNYSPSQQSSKSKENVKSEEIAQKPYQTAIIPQLNVSEAVVICPLCQTSNKLQFNFCVECAFDLRDYKVIQKQSPIGNANKNTNEIKNKSSVVSEAMDVDVNNDENPWGVVDVQEEQNVNVNTYSKVENLMIDEDGGEEDGNQGGSGKSKSLGI